MKHLPPHLKLVKFSMFIDQKLDLVKKHTTCSANRSGKGREAIALLQSKFPSANLVEQGLSNIGASVSDQITNDAISSVLVALIGILLYVAIRFEMGYAIGAVVATVHDVL